MAEPHTELGGLSIMATEGIHTISNGVLTVCIAEQAAELQSIRSGDGTEYLWQGDSRYWADRSPHLFPYVGRLIEGSYCLDGALYHMDIHGITPYRRFSVAERSKSAITLALCSDEETMAHYPRAFAFRVHYILDGNTLSITYEVENRDTKTMYFGLGGHPGFNVPLVSGRSFGDYRLRFDATGEPVRIGFTEDCFVSGVNPPFPLAEGCLPLRHDLFDRDAIVLQGAGHTVTLESPGDGHSVTVSYPQMPYIGFWHCPKTEAPFLCIEPWISLPSKKGAIAALEKQEDLIRLGGGKRYENRWSITISQ